MARSGYPFVMQYVAAVPGPRDAGARVIEIGLRTIAADETAAKFHSVIVRGHRDD